MIPLIYVAGPYRDPTSWEIQKNIHEARLWGAVLAKAGAYPVIPHSNTANFDGLANDAFWLGGTMELLRRCDGIALVGRWDRSSGTMAELEEAKRIGLPVVDCGHTSENGAHWAKEKINQMIEQIAARKATT